MKIKKLNSLNTYFDPGVGHAKGRGKKIRNRSENIVCTDDNIKDIIRQEIQNASSNSNETIDLNHLDVSGVHDMSFLFNTLHNLKWMSPDVLERIDISRWDTSNVTNMKYMFSKTKFNGDISNWNTSKVEDMDNMFIDSQFNGDISKWDVSKVKYMHNMFEGSPFNQDISNWDVSNVVDMTSMFFGNKHFNQDISKWDISNVKYMDFMFYSAQSFYQDLSSWKIPPGTATTNMFANTPMVDRLMPAFL